MPPVSENVASLAAEQQRVTGQTQTLAPMRRSSPCYICLYAVRDMSTTKSHKE
jgi:hypothetical protein